MDNWDDLRFVVALARYGSMANAARHLRTNTATVSRRIKRLNETADNALFQKGASEWELTPEGRRLYDMAANFGEELENFKATSHTSKQSIQTVRVTSLDFLNAQILAPSMGGFHKHHPNIALELSATDRNVSLAYGEADIALRLSRPREGRLMARRIADLKIGVFGHKDSKEQNWIGLPYELDWTPEMKNGHAHFGCEPALRVSSYLGILKAMKETGLCGIVPQFLADGFGSFELLQPKEERCNREVWMLVHETRKNDLGIRNTCRWIEHSYTKIREN